MLDELIQMERRIRNYFLHPGKVFQGNCSPKYPEPPSRAVGATASGRVGFVIILTEQNWFQYPDLNPLPGTMRGKHFNYLRNIYGPENAGWPKAKFPAP